MLIPLYDDNPFRRISYAYVNWALIAANVLVFTVFSSGFFYDLKLADTFSYLLRHVPGGAPRHMDLPPEYMPSPTG